jgi:S-adenosylmethionine decarboxylase
LNLLGLPRILEIAREHASLLDVYRCFYSRKSFFFPERQKGPHREWKDEVEYLDKIFLDGGAYSVGKMNGDHWLLYITSPQGCTPNVPVLRSLLGCAQINGAEVHGTTDEPAVTLKLPEIDTTIEILMTHLSPVVRRSFNYPDDPGLSNTPFDRAREISSNLGIADLFPQQLTTLDSYAFSPCGYSANALVQWGEVPSSPLGEDHDPGCVAEGYYNIHVTPEDGWSYASFECNVPLSPVPAPHSRHMPDLETLVRRVVGIFRPARLTLTLFISSAENDQAEEMVGESPIEAAQRAFKMALTNHSTSNENVDDGHRGVYIRTDKINYDFGDYDLAFASFELAAP